MNRISKAVVALVTTAALLVAGAVSVSASHQAELPDAAANGQGKAAVDLSEKFAEAHDRLLGTLEDVVDRLEANGADQAAIDAVSDIMNRLSSEDIGLNRAEGATSGDHPSAGQHP